MKLGGPPKVEIQAEALDTLVEKYVICSSLERRDVLEQCAVASLDLHLCKSLSLSPCNKS